MPLDSKYNYNGSLPRTPYFSDIDRKSLGSSRPLSLYSKKEDSYSYKPSYNTTSRFMSSSANDDGYTSKTRDMSQPRTRFEDRKQNFNSNMSFYSKPYENNSSRYDSKDYSKPYENNSSRFETKDYSKPYENNSRFDTKEKYSFLKEPQSDYKKSYEPTNRISRFEKDTSVLKEPTDYKKSFDSNPRTSRFDKDNSYLERRNSTYSDNSATDNTLKITEKIEKTLHKHNVNLYEEKAKPSEQDRSRTDSNYLEKCKYLQDRGTHASEKNTLEINNRISRDSEAYLIRLTKYINPRKKDVSLQTEEFYLKDRTKKEEDPFDYFDHVKKTCMYSSTLEKEKNPPKIEKNESYSFSTYRDKSPITHVVTTPSSGGWGAANNPPLEKKPAYVQSAPWVKEENQLIEDKNYLKSDQSFTTKNVKTEFLHADDKATKEKESINDRKISFSDKKQDFSVKNSEICKNGNISNFENNEHKNAAAVEKAQDNFELKERENYENENISNNCTKSEIKSEPSTGRGGAINEIIPELSGGVSSGGNEAPSGGSGASYGGYGAPFGKSRVPSGGSGATSGGGGSPSGGGGASSGGYGAPFGGSGAHSGGGGVPSGVGGAVKMNGPGTLPVPPKPVAAQPSPPMEEDDELDDDEEWEYYSEEDELDVLEEEEEEEEDETPGETSKNLNDNGKQDFNKNWIKNNIFCIIPKLPLKKRKKINDLESSASDNDDENEDENIHEDSEINDNFFSQENGYQKSLSEVLNETTLPLDNENTTEENPEESTNLALKIITQMKSENASDVKQILFSLKDFFQSDSNLVYEFIEAGGLQCLVDIGTNNSEQNLKNFVLRSLGQLMLYVDGMKGVIENNKAIELLYSLISSSSKLVVKTAIKLLLVFIDYNDTNYILLIQAIKKVSEHEEEKPWSYIAKHMCDVENLDEELCTFAFTLLNKTLYEIDDQSTFYEQTDYLEELGIENITIKVDELNCTSLIEEIQLYNVALKQEDGLQVTEEDISALYQDSSLRLRTSLRVKNHSGQKSLRFRINQAKTSELDENDNLPEIDLFDLKRILMMNNINIEELNEETSDETQTTDAIEEINEESSETQETTDFIAKIKKAYFSKIKNGEDEHCDINQNDQIDELQWEKIKTNLTRPLFLHDYDFTDLFVKEENTSIAATKPDNSNIIPAPPPLPPAKPTTSIPAPPPIPSSNEQQQNGFKADLDYQKTKKTIKLFWKDLKHKPSGIDKTIWDEIVPISVDYKVLEFLFESRAKEFAPKEQGKIQLGPMKEIIVLDNKRSNFINIGMTKLPPPRIIKEAVINMDSSIINKEGIEKLLTMLPSDEEISKIEEALEANMDLPLGTAEQFLMTLSSIPGLEARLRLWSFKLDFGILEKEILEQLSDLKQGLETLKKNKTFLYILSVILEIGNFLNNSSSKGFEIEYLAKIPEVKDTVYKHSLLYHLTFWLLESYPSISDLYSELGAVTRASKTDFEDLAQILNRLEEECKRSWNFQKSLAKIEDNSNIDPQKNKIQEFLSDSAERIMILQKINTLMRNSFTDFLLWLGISKSFANEYKINAVLKTISEFALEFRTSREKALQILKFKQEAKQRNKSKSKLNERSEMKKKNSSSHDLNMILGEIPLRKKKKHRRPKTEETKTIDNNDSSSNQAVNGEKVRRRRRREERKINPENLEANEEYIPKPRPKRSSNEEYIQQELRKESTTNSNNASLLESLLDMGKTSLKKNGERKRSSRKREVSQNSQLRRSRTRENTDQLNKEEYIE